MTDAPNSCVDCGIPRDDVKKKKLSRGRCSRCYQRHLYALKKSGSFESLHSPQPVLDRFLARVSKAPNGCHLWTGSMNHHTGYGRLSVDGKEHYAHRLAYTLLVGSIPDGMDVDHMCHNGDATCNGEIECQHRRCVNPDHLEPVPHRVNMTRSHLAIAGKNARKTHCKRGHEFTPENTITRKTGRACRTCHNLGQREYGARKRAERRAA